MNTAYVLIEDVKEHGQVPKDSILSSTLHRDDRTKVILFRFAAGQELSAHSSPVSASLFFVSGQATLRLGDDVHEVQEGAFVMMPPRLEHGIKAKTELTMLLTMIQP